jgi:hypothetical protein
MSDYDCMMCHKPLADDYDPQMCCSGYDCGCRGQPTNPPICSDACWDALMKRNGTSDPTSTGQDKQ